MTPVAVEHQRGGCGKVAKLNLTLEPADFRFVPCLSHDPLQVPLGLARKVGSATVGSSGHGWRGYCPRISLRTSV